VDDKTVEALTTSGCTGWGTFPVTVDSGRRPPVVFYGLSITGRAGAGRSDDSLVDGTTLGFDPDEWDGSDIFTFAEMDFTLTTQRVMDAFTKARIMGWYFCQFDPRGTLLNSKAFYEQLKAEGKI
jgi:hypothetical protein